MNTASRLLSVSLASLFLSVANAQAATILYENNFQTDTVGGTPAGWTTDIGSIETVDHLDGQASGANKFMRLTSSNSSNPAIDTQTFTSIAFSTLGLSNITFAFDYAGTRTEGPDTLTFLGTLDGVNFTPILGALALGAPSSSGDGGLPWTPFMAQLTNVVATAIRIQFQYRSSSNAEAAYVDNIMITAVPVPAALPLGAAALGGLGLLGWSRRSRKTAAVA
ncbi:MAG: hypothetical protein ACO1OG_10980 [Devosia sp.]